MQHFIRTEKLCWISPESLLCPVSSLFPTVAKHTPQAVVPKLWVVAHWWVATRFWVSPSRASNENSVMERPKTLGLIKNQVDTNCPAKDQLL